MTSSSIRQGRNQYPPVIVLTDDIRRALTIEADGANPVGMTNYLIVSGTARLVEGGAPQLRRWHLEHVVALHIPPRVSIALPRVNEPV